MDATPRIEALRTAKAIIGSHGVVAHMNKYNRDVLAREVTEGSMGMRCDFNLDPARSAWHESNPSVTLVVAYNADPKGAQLNDEGAMVIENYLRIAVGTSGGDMDLETLKQRESMVSMVAMLGEMLTTTLPQKITLTMESPAQVVERTQRQHEQLVGKQIYDNLGEAAFKGLRVNGSGRFVRLTSTYASVTGKYPDSGTYRFRHVRRVDRRGCPKEVTHYSIRVYGCGDGSLPPSVAIRRIEAV